MSAGFPNPSELKVIDGMIKFLSDAQNGGRCSDEQQELLEMSLDCLKQLGSDDCSNAPDLISLIGGVGKSTSSNVTQVEPMETETKTAKKQKPNCSFQEFVDKAEKAGFFKNATPGSKQWEAKYEEARQRYNARFPDHPVPKPASEQDKNKAKSLKDEGNQLLRSKNYDEAIGKYSEAINLDPQNAVYYSNRSAAYMHTNEFENAAKDAEKAIELNPKWIKAYMRLGIARTRQEEFEKALEAYETALTFTKASDALWEQVMNAIDGVKKKMQLKNPAPANPFASGMGGGMGGMGGGMPGGFPGGFPGFGGGGGGGGGMPDFASLMNNPMVSKMMQDPNMMSKMAEMMKSPAAQEMAKNLFSGGGGGGGGGGPPNLEKLMALNRDPEKLRAVLNKLTDDPEYKALVQQDPSIGEAIEATKMGDPSKMTSMLTNPHSMKIIGLINKHLD